VEDVTQLARLDDLARGNIAIAEAVKLVRESLTSGDEPTLSLTYTALKDFTWQTVSQGAPTEDLRAWFDILKHASVLLRRRGANDLSSRLIGHSELVAQSIRFSDLQPIEAVLRRKHVLEILRLIGAQGGTALRSVISDKLAIEDANLSRVMTIILNHKLVRRDSVGKEAKFTLTASGREIIGDEQVDTLQKAAAESNPHPFAQWSDTRGVCCQNSAFKAICDEFEIPGGAVDFDAWFTALDSRAVERVLDDAGGYELKFSDGRWLRFLGKATDGRMSATMEDITGRKVEQEAMTARLQRLSERRNSLQEEVATLNARVDSYQKAVGDARSRLLSFAEYANSCLVQAGALSRELGDPATALTEALSDAEGWLANVRVSLRDFLQLPFPSKAGEDAGLAGTSLIRPSQLLRDLGSLVNRIPQQDVEMVIQNLKPFHGFAEMVKATMGQLLLTTYDRLHPHKFEAVNRANDFLIKVDLSASEHPDLPKHVLQTGFNIVPEDPVEDIKDQLGYAIFLVEQAGGRFFVHPSRLGAEVNVIFPYGVEPQKRTHRGSALRGRKQRIYSP